MISAFCIIIVHVLLFFDETLVHLSATEREGAAVVLWLSSWLAEQEVQGLIPGLAATIPYRLYIVIYCSCRTLVCPSYLLLPSCNMAERLLKRHKSSKQPNQPTNQDSAYSIENIIYCNYKCKCIYKVWIMEHSYLYFDYMIHAT